MRTPPARAASPTLLVLGAVVVTIPVRLFYDGVLGMHWLATETACALLSAYFIVSVTNAVRRRSNRFIRDELAERRRRLEASLRLPVRRGEPPPGA